MATLSKRKTKTGQPHIFKGKAAFKYVVCTKCGYEEVKVSDEAISAICWRCCQKMVEPPKQLMGNKNGKPARPRGWAWMA